MNPAPEAVDWNEILPLAHGARVVAVSERGLMALDKPDGLMTHPNKDQDRNYSLLDAAYDFKHERYHWTSTGPNDPGFLYLVNRIDSPTSGLVVAALTEEAAVAGRKAFAKGEVEKTYFALVLGKPVPRKGLWVNRLAQAPSPGRGVRMAIGRPGPTVMAKSEYETLESHPNARAMLSLLRLRPITGRTHQLRVQCAARRHPIVGDGTYGDFPFNHEFARRTGHKRLFLHAAKIRIPSLDFTAESAPSREFQMALGKDIEPSGRNQ